MKTTKFNCFVGIDISKNNFDVALLVNDEFTFSNRFDNNQAGYQKFLIWLKSKKVNLNTVLFCMEKTGYYSIKLSNFLFTNKCKVWLEDPIKIAKSNTFKRGKSDKIDAKRIAIYASKFFNTLNLFEPKNEIYDKMQHLFNLRERLLMVLNIIQIALNESKGIFENKFQKMLEGICCLPILYLKKSIKEVDKKLDDLIKENKEINKKYKITKSVKGVGKQTAIYLLIISRGFTKIKSSRSCSCFAGTAPFEYNSGTSIKGKTRVSIYGNKKLKKLLHLGAISIISCQKGEEYDYYCRKVKEGKNKMKVINALRNKMLSRVFACIREGREYEENYKKLA